jgi:hypothetical protein
MLSWRSMHPRRPARGSRCGREGAVIRRCRFTAERQRPCPMSHVVARPDLDEPTAVASKIRRSKASRLLFVEAVSQTFSGMARRASLVGSPLVRCPQWRPLSTGGGRFRLPLWLSGPCRPW